MTVFWPGLFAIFGLYVAVFLVGIWAGREAPDTGTADELLLAGRNLPLWVGFLTMTATWVGGGYINGTAEYTYSSGILWGAQAGFGYALALIVGGIFYARTMRRAGYATLIDPLDARYGRRVAALLMIPAVVAELFWSAAILVALGTTFSTVIGVDLTTSILVSSAVAVGYTVFGGLRAVAYTDVIQLALIVIGLGLAVPYTVALAGGFRSLNLTSLHVSSVSEALSWGDYTLLLILGGIPWNVYFQRVLSARTPRAAATLSIAAGFLCALMAVPPVLIGLAALNIDWSALALENSLPPNALIDVLKERPAVVLPYTLRYAVPQWIGVFGLGAVGAAVMSSVDSSILSAASLVTWNGYRRFIDPDIDGAKLTRVVQVLIVLLGGAATLIALSVSSISALWLLCGDLVYSVLFPQLTLALFDRKANRIGAISGLLLSGFLRLGGGDKTLGLLAFLPYPEGDFEFPFRTLAMVAGLLGAIVISRLTVSIDPPRAIP